VGHAHAVSPFGLIDFPRIAFGYRALGDAAQTVHLVSQWFLHSLIALHLLGVSYHLVLKRDNLLARMLPPQILEHTEGH
jgi:cytochrome b561